MSSDAGAPPLRGANELFGVAGRPALQGPLQHRCRGQIRSASRPVVGMRAGRRKPGRRSRNTGSQLEGAERSRSAAMFVPAVIFAKGKAPHDSQACASAHMPARRCAFAARRDRDRSGEPADAPRRACCPERAPCGRVAATGRRRRGQGRTCLGRNALRVGRRGALRRGGASGTPSGPVTAHGARRPRRERGRAGARIPPAAREGAPSRLRRSACPGGARAGRGTGRDVGQGAAGGELAARRRRARPGRGWSWSGSAAISWSRPTMARTGNRRTFPRARCSPPSTCMTAAAAGRWAMTRSSCAPVTAARTGSSCIMRRKRTVRFSTCGSPTAGTVSRSAPTATSWSRATAGGAGARASSTRTTTTST